MDWSTSRTPSAVEDEVRRLYLSGRTIQECADLNRLAYNTVRKILRRLGVPHRSKGFTRRTRHEAAILGDFRAGVKPSVIAGKYAVVLGTVRNVVLRAGMTYPGRSQSHRVLPLNEGAFASLSSEAEYWLGFLLADGGVQSVSHGDDRDVLRVNLAQRDRDHLGLLREFLGAGAVVKTPPLSFRDTLSSLPRCYLSVSSRRLVTDLVRWGVVPRKSLTAVVHDDLKGSADFWRGVVDGDGCLYWHRGRRSRPRVVMILTGSEHTIRAFAAFARAVGVAGKGICAKRRNIWEVRFYGSDAKLLASVLYDRPGPHLARKKVIAEAFKKHIC